MIIGNVGNGFKILGKLASSIVGILLLKYGLDGSGRLPYLVKVAAEGVRLEILLKYEPKVCLSVGLAKRGFVGLLGSIAALIDAVE